MEESEPLLHLYSSLGIGIGGSYCSLPSTPHMVQKHPFDGEDKLKSQYLCQETDDCGKFILWCWLFALENLVRQPGGGGARL